MSHELVELMTAGIELLMKHLLTSTLYNLEKIARDVSGETSLAAKSEEKRGCFRSDWSLPVGGTISRQKN